MKIGIDLGGTDIKAIRLTDDGSLDADFTIPTPAHAGRSAIFHALYCAIDALWTEGITTIGISSAGNIDPLRGVCVYATENLRGWTGAKIAPQIEKKYQVRTVCDNDAICALKGELAFYPTARNVTMLTLGTGLGGASLVDGKILRGKNYDAARWGHFILVPKGLKCTCGKRGCAECYVSGSGLIRDGQRKMLGIVNAKQIFDRYVSGEPEARDVIEKFGFYLNVLLTNIRATLSPDFIILGGGIAQSETILRELIADNDDIVFARLGNLAGAYGAVSNFKNRYLPS